MLTKERRSYELNADPTRPAGIEREDYLLSQDSCIFVNRAPVGTPSDPEHGRRAEPAQCHSNQSAREARRNDEFRSAVAASVRCRPRSLPTWPGRTNPACGARGAVLGSGTTPGPAAGAAAA